MSVPDRACELARLVGRCQATLEDCLSYLDSLRIAHRGTLHAQRRDQLVRLLNALDEAFDQTPEDAAASAQGAPAEQAEVPA